MIMFTGFTAKSLSVFIILIFSNFISPAMLIKRAEQIRNSNEEDNDDNVYEEIIHAEEKVEKDNKHGRKQPLTVYKEVKVIEMVNGRGYPQDQSLN